jgi:hypothetical protein
LNTLPESLHRRYPPAADAFLEFICPLTKDRTLEELAFLGGDYLVEQTRAVLHTIRDNRFLPSALDFQTREVLHLGRWSTPDISDKAGHIQRAFCGAVLLRANTTPEMEDINFGDQDTLVLTLESALTLGKNACLSLLRFLFWCVPQKTNWYLENRPYYTLAILILVLKYDKNFTNFERSGVLSYFLWTENQLLTLEGSETISSGKNSTRSIYNGIREENWHEQIQCLKADYSTYPDIATLVEHLTG